VSAINLNPVIGGCSRNYLVRPKEMAATRETAYRRRAAACRAGLIHPPSARLMVVPGGTSAGQETPRSVVQGDREEYRGAAPQEQAISLGSAHETPRSDAVCSNVKRR
jgi:hypothetical protein